METLDRVVLALIVALMVAVACAQSYRAGQRSMVPQIADVSQNLGDCWQSYNNSEAGQN